MGSWFSVTLDDVTLARARRGDLGALEAVCRAFEAPVYTLARRLVRDPHDAEDVLQETFLEVVRSIGRYRGDGPFAGWLRQVAASKAVGRLRHRRVRAGETSLDADDEGGGAVPEPAVEPAHPGDRLDVVAALERLSDSARAVVWLHDVEGYTHDEIAALMGRTASFSKSQLARAHERLRGTLAGQGETERCTRTLVNS
jgi:RNA polymerase sigma-70 factor (ECF subfamily)